MKKIELVRVLAVLMVISVAGVMACKKEQRPLPRIKSVKILQEKPKPGDKLEVSVDNFDPAAEPSELEYRWSVDGKVKAGETGKTFKTKDLPEKTQILVEARVKGKETGRTGEWSKSLPVALIKPIPTLGSAKLKPAEAFTSTPLEVEVDYGEIDPSTPLFYQWNIVRNDKGKIIKGKLKVTGDKLDGGVLRRGDKIQVEVSTKEDKFVEPYAIKSNLITIQNSPPHMTSCVLNDTQTSIKIICQANDDDGDALSYYTVEGPSSGKISMEKGRGVLTLNFSDTKPDSYKIKIGVKDDFGGIDVYEIPTPVKVK